MLDGDDIDETTDEVLATSSSTVDIESPRPIITMGSSVDRIDGASSNEDEQEFAKSRLVVVAI